MRCAGCDWGMRSRRRRSEIAELLRKEPGAILSARVKPSHYDLRIDTAGLAATGPVRRAAGGSSAADQDGGPVLAGPGDSRDAVGQAGGQDEAGL